MEQFVILPPEGECHRVGGDHQLEEVWVMSRTYPQSFCGRCGKPGTVIVFEGKSDDPS